MIQQETTKLLSLICVVDWLANDLHYNSEGSAFYAQHLLSDRIRDFGSADDDLKEALFKGLLDQQPPLDIVIAKMSCAIYESIGLKCSAKNNECYLAKLKYAFEALIKQVEICKAQPELPGGIHAILDDISKRALTYKFLVAQQMKTVGAQI